MFSRLAVAVSFVALFAGVQAQNDIQIISPGGSDLWWVASSVNVITWDCATSPFQNFSVVLANQNPTTWAPLTIIAVENNFVCSQSITADQQNAPAGSGYLIQFVNDLNSTQIYGTSQPFEIKPVGSTYPATTATPQGSSTAAPSASGVSSSSTTQATGASKTPSGAIKNTAAGLVAAAAAAAALGLFFA